MGAADRVHDPQPGGLLGQNTMARLLFGAMCSVAESDRNVVWRWFTDPEVREH
jgi:hypothetical protein